MREQQGFLPPLPKILFALMLPHRFRVTSLALLLHRVALGLLALGCLSDPALAQVIIRERVSLPPSANAQQTADELVRRACSTPTEIEDPFSRSLSAVRSGPTEGAATCEAWLSTTADAPPPLSLIPQEATPPVPETGTAARGGGIQNGGLTLRIHATGRVAYYFYWYEFHEPIHSDAAAVFTIIRAATGEEEIVEVPLQAPQFVFRRSRQVDYASEHPGSGTCNGASSFQGVFTQWKAWQNNWFGAPQESGYQPHPYGMICSWSDMVPEATVIDLGTFEPDDRVRVEYRADGVASVGYAEFLSPTTCSDQGRWMIRADFDQSVCNDSFPGNLRGFLIYEQDAGAEEFDHIQAVVAPDAIFEGETARVLARAVDASGNTIHVPDRPLSLSHSGLGYGSFVDRRDGSRFDTRTVNYDALRARHIEFVADGDAEVNGSTTFLIRIEDLTSGGTSTAPLTVATEDVARFDVLLTTPMGWTPYLPLVPGDLVYIDAAPLTALGTPAAVPADMLLDVALDAVGASVGHLYRSDTGEAADLLTNVPLNALNTGAVAFLYSDEAPPTGARGTMAESGARGAGGATEAAVIVALAADPNVSGTATFAIEATFDHFAVTLVPDTIVVGEAAAVGIEARDAGDTPIEISSDTPVLLSATSPHGRLVRVTGGDTTAVSAAIPYGELSSAEILFVADGTWPETATAVSVQARQEGDDATAGSASVTVLAPALELVLSVDPTTYLPAEDDELTAAVHLRNFPEGGDRRVRFELTQAHEFEWATGGNAPLEVVVEGDSAQAVLKSLTWWGVATVEATFEPNGARRFSASRQVPLDTDGDTIADAWELDPANGGTLALGSTSMDGGWDEEMPQSTYPGDGFSKLEEYQGFVYGAAHVRTNPYDGRDLFVNTTNAPATGQFAVDGLRQLGLTPTPAGSDAVFLAASTTPVTAASLLEVNRTNSSVDNGIFFTSTGASIPNKPPLTLGITRRASASQRGVSYVYLKTIDNVFNANTIPENVVSTTTPCPLEVQWPVPTTSGSQTYVAVFDGSDLNGNGTRTDPINPLDIAGPAVYRPSTTCTGNRIALTSGNRPEDGVIATLTQPKVVLRTGRHEFGHQAIWYGVGIDHPGAGATVMRQGIGPAKVGSFNANDIANIRLK